MVVFSSIIKGQKAASQWTSHVVSKLSTNKVQIKDSSIQHITYHALLLASTNHELSHDRVISSSSITDSITIRNTFQNENVGFEIVAICCETAVILSGRRLAKWNYNGSEQYH